MVGGGKGDSQLDVVPLLNAIVVCCSWGREGWRPTLGERTWCHCWVSLQGAILVCYGWGTDEQLWGSGRGAIAGCHCRAPISLSYLPLYIQGHQFHPDTQENSNEICLELLADVTLFSTLITQKLFFAIWGLWRYNFFFWLYFSVLLFIPPYCRKFGF